jgi:transposase-like protein
MKMSKKEKKVSLGLKQEVLEAMASPGRCISEVVAKYGIAKSTAYKWMRADEQLKRGLSQEDNRAKFVELSVNEDAVQVCLKRASLTFADLRITIEGKIKLSCLAELIKLLGEAC